MALETVPDLTAFVGGPSTDGKAIVMEWALDNGEKPTFGIPLGETVAVIAYLFNMATLAAKDLSAEELVALGDRVNTLPISVTYIALGPGTDDRHETLYLKLGPLMLSFKVSTENLLTLARAILPPPGAAGRN